MSKYNQYIGQKINKLTLIKVFVKDNDKTRKPAGKFECECGNQHICYCYDWLNGNVKSCGCGLFRYDVELIKDLYYNQKLSLPKIAEKLGAHAATIRNTLKYQDLDRRSISVASRLHHNTTTNDYVFDIITEESAYWVGFLLADGTIYQNKVQLELGIKDIDHLEKFKLFIEGNQVVRTVNKKNGIAGPFTSCIYQVCSEYLVNKLKEYNIISNKTFLEKCPDELLYNRHFWRGYIDGDGYYGNYQSFVIGLCGNEVIIDQFIDYCESFPLKINNSIYPTGNIYDFKLHGNNAKYISWELNHDANIYLKRKRKILIKNNIIPK